MTQAQLSSRQTLVSPFQGQIASVASASRRDGWIDLTHDRVSRTRAKTTLGKGNRKMNKLACPTVDELSRFNPGKLPEDETIRIGKHLDECEACRAMIETISDASDTLAGEKVVLSVRLVEGEVQVVQKDDEQTLIGRKAIARTDYALVFDGQSSYVEIPMFKVDGSHPVTIEASVKVTDRKQSHVIKGYGDHELALHLAGNAWKFSQSSGSTGRFVELRSASESTRRIHIAGVWDKDQPRRLLPQQTPRQYRRREVGKSRQFRGRLFRE